MSKKQKAYESGQIGQPLLQPRINSFPNGASPLQPQRMRRRAHPSQQPPNPDPGPHIPLSLPPTPPPSRACLELSEGMAATLSKPDQQRVPPPSVGICPHKGVHGQRCGGPACELLKHRSCSRGAGGVHLGSSGGGKCRAAVGHKRHSIQGRQAGAGPTDPETAWSPGWPRSWPFEATRLHYFALHQAACTRTMYCAHSGDYDMRQCTYRGS